MTVGAGCSRGPQRPLVVVFPVGLHSTDVNDPVHEGYAINILGNVYETLVELQPDLSLRPGLAESWRSPDDVTWIFTLRRGVRFHDGRPLTASDVVASFERGRRNPWLREETQGVVDVRARGEREVVFTTRARYDGLLERLTYLFVTGPPPPDGSPAPGTGPYRLASWREGTTVLEAVPGHRDGDASVRVVEFEAVADPGERAACLWRGDADLVADVMPEDVESTPARPTRVVTGPGLRVLLLGMDCARPLSPYVRPSGNPFRDRRVREAVSLAVDRAALVAGALHGHGEPVGQLLNPTEVGFDPAVPAPEPDPVKASRLVEQVAPGGFDVALDYLPGKFLAAEGVVRALASQLARAGIRVVPRPSTQAAFWARMLDRDISLYLVPWANDSGSALETYETLLHSPRDGHGAYNAGGYSSPALDALLDAVPREASGPRRIEMLRAAARPVETDRPLIPLYRQASIFAFTPELEFEPRDLPRVRAARLRWKK